MILKMDTLQLENDLVKDHSRDNVIIISDPEDGEINDDSNLEDITDISSGEEKYLKERIKILEALDTALEKKEARRLSSLFISESHLVKPAVNIESLSDISSNAEDVIIVKNDENIKSNVKANKLNKRKRKLRPRSAIVKPHVNKKARRKITDPVKNESSSSESDDEKAHQRRRLRNAVRISPIGKTQKSSLKSRLLNMIKAPEIAQNTNEIENISGLPEESKLDDKDKITSVTDCLQYEALCSSDDDPEVLRQLALESKSSRNIKIIELNQDHISDVKSDEHDKNIDKTTHITDDIDSDTAELRTIALKSAMLKKAMERKKLKKTERKKQLKLRRSITTTFSDDALEKAIDFSPLSVILNEPETDIEAVDMEINDDINDSPIYENNIPSAHNIMFGQTQDNLAYQQQQMPEVYDDYHYGEYSPQPCDHYLYNNYYDNNLVTDSIQHNNNTLDKIDKQPIIQRDEDNDEDETLLRAQLLSSMSKNVRTLSSKPIASNQEDSFKSEIKKVAKPPDSNFVIKLADSDFDSECEATRNLITMHNKLKNQGEFEKNLEAFLKSARTKVENQLPTGQESVSSQLNHTPMAVKHLPVSHQQEYRQLIKRMAELDKVRQARKLVLENSIKISQLNTKLYPSKETLKSINGKNILMEMSNMLHTSTDNTQALSEQQIAISRQKISSQTKMLESLTKEGKALQQKNELLAIQFRAVAASLQSSRAALSQNQHKLQAANRNLIRLRKQHQILLTRSKGHSVKRGSYFSNIKLTKNPAISQNEVFKKNDATQRKSVSTELSKECSNLEKSVSKLILDNKNNSQITRLTENDKIMNIFKENEETKISIDHINSHRVITQEVMPLNEDSKSCLQNNAEIHNISKDDIPLLLRNINIEDSGISVKSSGLFKDASSVKIKENIIDDTTADEKTLLERKNLNNTLGHEMSEDNHMLSVTIEEDIKNNSAEVEDQQHKNTMKNSETPGDSSNFSISAIDMLAPLILEDCEPVKSPKNTHLVKDYKSPLQFLQYSSATDIQAIFCPFEVGGSCKDPECKYYHPKI